LSNKNPGGNYLQLGEGRFEDMSIKHQINPGSFSGQAGYTQLVGDDGDHIHTYKLARISQINFKNTT
jgi:hypothetical protein